MPNAFKRLDGWATRHHGYGWYADGDGVWLVPVAMPDDTRPWYVGVRWTMEHTESGIHRHEGMVVAIEASAETFSRSRCDRWDEMDEDDPIQRAESLLRYGIYAPIAAENGRDVNAVLAHAWRSARTYRDDPALLPGALDVGPVNAIGQTPREFMAAGLDGLRSAIERGISAGDPTATRMARAYDASGGKTLGAGVMPPFGVR